MWRNDAAVTVGLGVSGRDSIRGCERRESVVVVERAVLLDIDDNVLDGGAARTAGGGGRCAGSRRRAACRTAPDERHGKPGEAESTGSFQELAPPYPLAEVRRPIHAPRSSQPERSG